MHFAYLAVVGSFIVQANSALVSDIDGTTITVTVCEPITHIAAHSPNATVTASTSESWYPDTTPSILTTTELLVPPPNETSSTPPVPTGGAMPRPVETSIAGLIGFLIVSLIVL